MTTWPIADARANFSELVDEVERTHRRVEITQTGRRAAVLMSRCRALRKAITGLVFGIITTVIYLPWMTRWVAERA